MSSAFNDRFEGLTPAQKEARYLRLAGACLKYYTLTDPKISFIGHNAGVTYRVETADGAYLLKIAEFIGDEPAAADPEPIRSGLLWLEALARDTRMTVQRPVRSRAGELLAAITLPDLERPIYCSLQQWIEGDHPRNPSAEHAYQIGALMAWLHQHGSQWIQSQTLDVWQHDEAWLRGNFEMFARVRPLAILSDTEWAAVEAAYERIRALMQMLGREMGLWGPIHSDLHHTNLVICNGEMCPIDFGGLIVGYHGLDLGVTLYHFMYLDASIRRALIDGYQSQRDLGVLPEMSLEAFLCAEALANLAFNVNLPDQRTSDLFSRNVREFAGVFCQKLVDGIPFALQPSTSL